MEDEYDTTSSTTEAALRMLNDLLEDTLREMAGHPLAFVLVLTDGDEFATTTNVPLQLCTEILFKSMQGAARRLHERDED